MLKKLVTIRRIFEVLRKGENVGDVAILKLTLFDDDEGPNQHRDQVQALHSYIMRPITMEALAQSGPGTFGRAYFEFMTRFNLKPFNFSQDVSVVIEKFPVSARYARVHDMIHVLLGFDADLAGELGVYSFVYAQDYSRFLTRAYRTGRIVTRLMKPWEWRKFTQAELRGKALAQGAKLLIAEPLEDYLERDLNALRAELLPAF